MVLLLHDGTDVGDGGTMENAEVTGKTPVEPARKLSGSFKLAFTGIIFLLGGIVVRLLSGSLHPPIYLFMLCGFVCFVGIITGLAEMVERIAKRKSSAGNRFILLGLILNILGWASAIGAFLVCSKDALSNG
jgi:hypothetical protein